MGTIRYSMEHLHSDEYNYNLLHVSQSRYEKDWHSIMHTHPFPEIFYVQDGSGVFLYDDVEYPISKNDIVIVNPNVPHTEKSSDSAPLQYISIGIVGFDFSFRENADYLIFSTNEKNPRFYFTSLLREMADQKPHYENICQHLLMLLLYTLERITDYNMQTMLPTAQVKQECLRVKRYIEANYMKDITLDTLVKISNLSKHYLVHSFTNSYSCSPLKYLCQKRIQESKELLLTTNLTIAEIASACGFSSQSYFAQSFRANCGMSASAYRSSHKS